MHQSCTVPKLASPVSCLVGRDTYGYRYGAHMEAVKDIGLSVELKAGNSSENAFSGTVSIERAGPSEESIRPRAAAEKFCGQIYDVNTKGASTAQGQGVDKFDVSFPSKCAQRLQGHEENLIASHEKVELIVQDMPIVGTSSLEKQVDTSVADAHRGSVAESLQDSKLGVNGCASVKRERSHQDLEEGRAEKRVKVEGNVGFLCSSVNGNGMGPTVTPRGVEYCQDTNPGDELAKERDDLRSLVQGTEIYTPAPNDTDLTDLLNDLDDAGDSELDEAEFGVGSHLWPETLCDEWLGNVSINENGVQAHTPQAETIAKALNISSEQAQRDGDLETMVQAHSPQPETIAGALNISSEQAQRDVVIGTTVQAHSPQLETIAEALNISSEQAQRDGDIGTTVQAHSPQLETIAEALNISSKQAQRDGDIETMVQAHAPLPETLTNALGLSSEQARRDGDIGTTVQAHDAIRKERPSAEIVILDSDSDDDDDLIMFDHLVETSQLKNTVKSEPGTGKLEKNISQLEDAVKIEPESLRQPERSYQLESAVKVEPEILRQPEKSYQLENAVKVEPENLRQPEKSSELVPSESSHLANAVKLELGGIRQAPDSRGSHGFEAPAMQSMHRAGQAQPGVMLQTIVHDGRLMWALVPQNTDTTLGSPYSVSHVYPRPPQANGLPNGLPYGLGCSSGFAPKNVRESFSSGEQAGPSHGWIPPTTSADVPFHRGHIQSSGMGNGNHAIAGQAVVSVPSPFEPAGNVQEAAVSGEQAGPSDGWTPPNSSAVVPYRYDSTVSSPRVEVTRALQQYLLYINKAKDDRARELAQRESTSNELVKEGNRRGLECRPDIVAYNDIKRAKADVNPGVNVGDLPGVEVGDTFTYRHQMAVVGLHRLPNVGIDYGYPPPDMIPTATAVVMMPKAGYVDDKDYGGTILYTGQGGRKKRNQQAPFVCDQELKKGNLALSKNFERKLPVRVIRGHMGTGSSGPGFLGYSYDGLYIIISFEFSDGINGFKVFKYHMERLEDQPPIPPCITGCTAHPWNTSRGAMEALPLQVMDPTVDVKPICMQVMDPPVELKQICI